MANLLGLAYEERESSFGVRMHDSIKSVLTEGGGQPVDAGPRNDAPRDRPARQHAGDDGLPRRQLFRAPGQDVARRGDKLLVISDRNEELQSTYRDMGIDDVMNLSIGKKRG